MYYPSAEEQSNAQLYADNFALFISKKLGIPYRRDVGIREKLMILQILSGNLSWEQAELILTQDDNRNITRSHTETAGENDTFENDPYTGIDSESYMSYNSSTNSMPDMPMKDKQM